MSAATWSRMTGLGRGLGIVIGHLVHQRHLRDAQAWLAGESLPESSLTALGLGTAEPDDREEDARQVVCALCRLASESLPIVFCFDQIEALQTSADDRDSLFRFGKVAADLAEADCNVLLISSIQSSFVDLFDAAVRQSHRDRAFRRRTSLETLSKEQIEALVRSRLDSVEAVRVLRAQRPGSSDYPFSPEFMATLKAIALPLPRRVFARANDEFARLQGLSASEPQGDTFLADTFARRRDTALAGVGTADSRAVLLHGLPMLWDLRKGVLRPATNADLDFLTDGPVPIAIAVSNESNMTSLAGRLRRLVSLYDGGATAPSAPPLRLVRDPRLPITRTAKKTLDYLKRLEQCGARVVKPSFEAVAALEALRTLLSDARAGDLACDGEVVSEAIVRAWLMEHLEDSLIELADAMVSSEEEDGRSADMRALEDFVTVASIAPLDQVASELHVQASVVLTLARRNPERIGVLHGPPTVLFARVPVEGLQAGGQ